MESCKSCFFSTLSAKRKPSHKEASKYDATKLNNVFERYILPLIASLGPIPLIFAGCTPILTSLYANYKTNQRDSFADTIYQMFFTENETPWSKLRLVGTAMWFTGYALRKLAVYTCGKQFTFKLAVKDDHQLVTRGIYSIVRHPSYSGLFLIFIGDQFTYGKEVAVWRFFMHALAELYMPHRCNVEDEQLRKHFGEEHAAYCAKVPYKLLPFVW